MQFKDQSWFIHRLNTAADLDKMHKKPGPNEPGCFYLIFLRSIDDFFGGLRSIFGYNLHDKHLVEHVCPQPRL